jgi:hypothetical protein
MSDIEQEIAEEMGDEETPDDSGADGIPEDGDGGAADSPGDEAAPPPRSQAEIDALTKKLEAEAARHEKRVAEIMGDDFALLVPSPVDWTPGYIFNVPEMHPQPEQVAALHALLGGAQPVELRPATDAEACEACNALGEVLTGSRKPGQETKPCVACGGTGWKPKSAPLAPVQVFPAGGNGNDAQPVQPNTLQVADRWGRPVGHPHYGLEPAFVGA